MCVPLGWGDSSPPLKSSGFFFMNRGFFGGRGIARPPSSSHPRCVHQQCRCVLRRRKDWHFSLPPHNVKEFSGGGGIGPPPHKSGECFGGGGTGPLPHNVGAFDDYLLAVQISAIGVYRSGVEFVEVVNARQRELLEWACCAPTRRARSHRMSLTRCCSCRKCK